MLSIPVPPSMVSLAAPPISVSLPPLPVNESVPEPPVRLSPNPPPIAVNLVSSLFVTVSNSPFVSVVTLASRDEPSTVRAVPKKPEAIVTVTSPAL